MASDFNILDGTDDDATPGDVEGIVAAKGDVLVGTADNTLDRLAVGTDGYVLTADSNEATGVKWAEASGEGGFDASIIDAKGDLIAGTANDSADNLAVGSDGTYLRAASGETTGLEWAAHNSTGDPHTQYALDTDLSTHAADTTSVHGIADTADLATASYVDDAISALSGTYVPLAEIDAKGDLLVGSAADTLNNLPVGTNGQVLTADSAETLGVKWAAAAGGSVVEDGRFAAAAVHLLIPGVSPVSVSTQALVADRLYYEPVRVATPITLDQLRIEVTTAAAASTVARLGIYEADTDWQPTDLVLDAGTVAIDSPGVKTASISQALSPGRYLFTMHLNGAPSVRVIRGDIGGDGVLAAVGTNPLFVSLTLITAYATLPSTGLDWDTATGGNLPFMHAVFCRVGTP